MPLLLACDRAPQQLSNGAFRLKNLTDIKRDTTILCMTLTILLKCPLLLQKMTSQFSIGKHFQKVEKELQLGKQLSLSGIIYWYKCGKLGRRRGVNNTPKTLALLSFLHLYGIRIYPVATFLYICYILNNKSSPLSINASLYHGDRACCYNPSLTTVCKKIIFHCLEDYNYDPFQFNLSRFELMVLKISGFDSICRLVSIRFYKDQESHFQDGLSPSCHIFL